MAPLGNALLIGPPGSGKTMWARRRGRHFSDALSKCDSERAYIYRVAGLPEPRATEATFRAPHHTCSNAGMLGQLVDGWRWRPGELSLAHGGTLFLDEVQEFNASLLMEVERAYRTREIQYYNRGKWYTVPCQFRLIVAGNPCPCGFVGVQRFRPCTCSAAEIARYAARIPTWIHEVCEVIPIERYTVEAAEK